VLTCAVMKTFRLDAAAAGDRATAVAGEIDKLLSEGKRVAVTVAEEQELLSPKQAARRLGFSRQHVKRLIDYGVLEARQPPGSSCWRTPLWSALALEERRAEHDRLTAEWSRDLDAMGAPAE
jgi:excisionase family DNA binding protein